MSAGAHPGLDSIEILDGPWMASPVYVVRHTCCEPDPSFGTVCWSPEEALALMREHRLAPVPADELVPV